MLCRTWVLRENPSGKVVTKGIFIPSLMISPGLWWNGSDLCFCFFFLALLVDTDGKYCSFIFETSSCSSTDSCFPGQQHSYVYVLGDRKDKSCKLGITKTSRNIYKEFVICHLAGEGEIYLHRFPDPQSHRAVAWLLQIHRVVDSRALINKTAVDIAGQLQFFKNYCIWTFLYSINMIPLHYRCLLKRYSFRAAGQSSSAFFEGGVVSFRSGNLQETHTNFYDTCRMGITRV